MLDDHWAELPQGVVTLQAETTCMAACSISVFHDVRFEGGTRLSIHFIFLLLTINKILHDLLIQVGQRLGVNS